VLDGIRKRRAHGNDDVVAERYDGIDGAVGVQSSGGVHISVAEFSFVGDCVWCRGAADDVVVADVPQQQ